MPPESASHLHSATEDSWELDAATAACTGNSVRGQLTFVCCDCSVTALTSLESVPDPPRCDHCHLSAVADLAQGDASRIRLAHLGDAASAMKPWPPAPGPKGWQWWNVFSRRRGPLS